MAETPQPVETAADDRAQVMRAAGLVAAAVLLSRVVGLVREMVTRSTLGVTTIDATAFDIAKAFPEAIFLIIAGGAIGSAFIPTFAAYFERDDEAGAWRLFAAIVNLVTVAMTVISILAMVFAEQIVVFFFAENIAAEPALLPLTVRLMRVMLLSPIIFGASGVIMGALNARQHFLLPALAPTVYNLGIIAGALIWRDTAVGPAMGLALGTVIGAAGHLLVQLPALRWKGARYSAVLTLRDRGVQTVLKLMAPRVLGLSFSEINRFVTLYLAGSMPLGSLPALTTAYRLLIMPQGILGQALGIAAFPTLSTLAARRAYDDMRQILSDSLRLLIYLGLPTSLLLILLREPIITVLFQRGLFGEESTQLVAYALLFYSLSLVALLMLEVIARTFYALSDTLTPVLAGGLQALLMAVLSVWLRDTVFASRGWEPLGALALGFSLSNYFEVGALLWLLRRKMGRLAGRDLVDGAWRMGLAALLATAALWAVLVLLPPEQVGWQLVVGTAVGGAVYVVATWLLRVREVRLLFVALRRQAGRLKSAVRKKAD